MTLPGASPDHRGGVEQMIDVQSGRNGTMTEITVTVSSADLLDNVCAAMSACSAFTRRAGELTQRVRCNKREADTINRRLAALVSAHRAAPAVVPTGNVVSLADAKPDRRQWVRRVMHLEYSPVQPAQMIGHGGATLRFTGWGQSFICTDELAEPEFHGQAVRYAYYA